MHDNVDCVRNFQAKMAKNFQAGRAEREAVCREYLAEDFECIEPPQMPVGGTFRGQDAVLKIMEIYDRYWTVECLKMEVFGSDDENVVAAKGTWRWTSKETARSITGHAVELFTLAGKKIKLIEVFQFDPAGIVATLPGRWRY